MRRAHVIAIPYPAQGHVFPIIEFAQALAQDGIKVTIVNTEFIHNRIIEPHLLRIGNDINHELINFASIPDGLEPWEDRSNIGKLLVELSKIMPEKIDALIRKINNETEGNEKVVCVIIDYVLKWPSELAVKLNIKRSAFLTAAAAWVALFKHASKMIDEGIIDNIGTPLKQEMIQLCEEMPAVSSTKLLWTCSGDLTTQKTMFDSITHNANSQESMDWIICNSSHELESGALKLVPKCLPIGPLLATNPTPTQEDFATLSWLDQQPPNSTIYVAFGSSIFLDENQFQELALGLELTNRPFLWVLRRGSTHNIDNAYPKGFEERIKNRGKIIVSWATQQKVLSHPSVACFLSHCSWNSSVESVSNGVPLLCWPCYADQLLNQSYIVNHWEVGLGLEKDDQNGFMRKEEIKNKVEKILIDQSYKRRALQLQAKIRASLGEGGISLNNFHKFIDWIKDN